MRTSFDIPETLVKEAIQVSGSKTKTQAIIVALTEMIQRKKSRRVLELKGSLKPSQGTFYDYKALRQKR